MRAPAVSAALPETPPDERVQDGLANRPFIGQAYLTGGFVYGHSTDPNLPFLLAGTGLEAGASFLLGPRFPGLQGGVWNGVLLQPGVSVYGAATVDIEQSFSTNSADAALMLSGGMLVGYQFLALGSAGNERQTGFGFSIGYRLAYQYDIVVSPLTGDSAGGGDISHGAVLSFVFPRYYPRNKHFGRMILNFEVDRLPDSELDLFKLNFGGGF